MPAKKPLPEPRHSEVAKRLGMAVRKRRTEREISQEALAEMASLSKNYIGNIERGEHDVTVVALKRVAVALGCRAADLLDAANV